MGETCPKVRPELAEQVEIDDKTYIEELLKGKAWLESQWKALQGELLAKDADLAGGVERQRLAGIAMEVGSG